MLSRAQPVSLSESSVMPSSDGCDQCIASRSASSSDIANCGSSKPMRRASRANISRLETASPSGATAGMFSVRYIWPHEKTRSSCSACVVLRQHDVRVAGGVGHELLADHREEVLAPEPGERAALVGRDDRGVGVVDEQRLDRRVELELAGERRAQLPLVDDPGPGADPVRAVHRADVQGERPVRELQDAAADLAPGAGQRGQRRDGADRLAAGLVALDGHADADRRRLRVAYSVARRSMSSAGTPVICATRSGG